VEHVLWIGGAARTGKTTIATRLTRRHGLRWYGSDTRTWEHRDRALRAGHDAARRWEAMTVEERWVTASPAELLELSLHAERGRMVADDVAALPEAPLVVAEGTPVSPRVAPDHRRAVWLLPTPAFQELQLGRLPRGPRELHLLLGETIAREARETGAPVVTVDGSRGIDDLVAEIEARFADVLAAGPRAETPAERRLLLREANEAIVAQVRGYHARPWAQGDADEVVRSFLCECGDPGCAAFVDAPVATAAGGPVLAANHRSAG
jgi:hypothetical protein